MINKIKKMKLVDWWHLFILVLCYIPSLIVRFVNRDIWIVSENGNDAKDNGYAFFKYMMKCHSDISCYYVIDNAVNDYYKVADYKKRLLKHNSLKCILYTMACKNYVSSQLASAFPYSNIFFNMYMHNFFKFNYVFLQHGITKENVECFHKKDSNIDLFCCAANPEYDYVKKYFGYKDYEVAKVGFCRYDNLNDNLLDKDYILYMPTWRKYLEVSGTTVTKSEEERFLNSDYYKNINRLINDSKIIKALEDNNKYMYFCLHDKAMAYRKFFKTKSKNIIIVDKNSEETIDVLIKKCVFFITDTSSVAFDFAYLKKKVLYYQFDYEDIIKSHWKKGYFDYKRDGFGKVVTKHNECVKEIVEAINNDCSNEKKYLDRIEDFYCYRDMNNCKRTYEKINELSQINSTKRQKKRINNSIIVFSIVLILSTIVTLLGYINNNLLFLLLGNLFVFFNNIYFGIIHLKKSVFFLLFNVSIFTFLLSKPLVQTIINEDWINKFSIYSQKMSMLSIWITLVCLFLGAYFVSKINFNNNKSIINKNNFFYRNRKIIEDSSFWLFLVTIIFKFVCEFEKLSFMTGKVYTEYYLSYTSNLPSIINLLGGMSTAFLIVYLVCLPKKKTTYLILILYVLSFVPTFLIGQRNPVVLSVLFAFSYYILRDFYGDENKWLGVKERILIIIAVPIVIVGLDVFNYVRSNEKVKLNFLNSFTDFFYTQGVSYDVLNYGYLNMETIQSMNKNYVFGPIYDYYQDNTIAKKVFKLPGLGNGNNETRALKGNSFTHILSYLARDDYLDGHGFGSSYLLELYCNYGFYGITFFSILLGAFLLAIPYIVRKRNLISIIVLYVTTTIFFLPRAETTSSILFIFAPHFWCALIAIAIITFIYNKIGDKNEN